MTIQKQLWTLICPDNNLANQTILTVIEEEFHYLANVLRLKPGDEIEITNCEGLKVQGTIQSFSKKDAKILLTNSSQQTPPSEKIYLYLAQPKPTTLEDIVSTVSEMGLDELHIFRSEKCVSKAPLKLDKLVKVSNEALRISKSSWSTKIFCYENLKAVLQKKTDNFKESINLFCDESHIYEGRVTNLFLQTLQEKYSPNKNINIFIGPEASFTKFERDLIFKETRCQAVSLGGNILKVQNAVYSAISIALQLRGVK